MTRYYVKITDEEPSLDEESLWFTLDSDSNTFYVVDKNTYDLMRTEWSKAVDNLEDSEALNNAVNNLIVSLTKNNNITVSKSNDALYLQDVDDPSKKHSYNTVENIRSNVISLSNSVVENTNRLNTKLSLNDVDNNLNTVSQNPVQNKVIKDVVDTINNNLNTLRSSLSSLQSSFNSHTHTGWTKVTFNYATLYYNAQLKLVLFNYVRDNVNLSSTSVILHESLITPTYRPKMSIICGCLNSTISAKVTTDGGIIIYTQSTGSGRAINFSAMWNV